MLEISVRITRTERSIHIRCDAAEHLDKDTVQSLADYFQSIVIKK